MRVLSRYAQFVLCLSILFGQTDGTNVSFEVTSVKPHLGAIPAGGGTLRTSGPRMTIEAYSVLGLLMYAYGIKPYQIANPESLDHTMYDVMANAEGGRVPTAAEFRLMMQSLLRDRFQLKVHHETRDIPVYALVVSRSGVKLKESLPGAEFKWKPGVKGRNYEVVMNSVSMDGLADYIRNNAGLDRPVVNLTGLRGTFDLTLTYTPEYRMAGTAPGDPDVIPISVAVQEQLGLRLERKNAPCDLLAIDRLEKPSGN